MICTVLHITVEGAELPQTSMPLLVQDERLAFTQTASDRIFQQVDEQEAIERQFKQPELPAVVVWVPVAHRTVKP